MYQIIETKEINLDEAIKHIYCLSKAAMDVLKFIRNNGDSLHTTEELARKLKLNLSTVQRAVKKLYDCGLLTMKQDNLKGGGYILLYRKMHIGTVQSNINYILRLYCECVSEGIKKGW